MTESTRDQEIKKSLRNANPWMEHKTLKLRPRREEVSVNGEWLEYHSKKMGVIPPYTITQFAR